MPTRERNGDIRSLPECQLNLRKPRTGRECANLNKIYQVDPPVPCASVVSPSTRWPQTCRLSWNQHPPVSASRLPLTDNLAIPRGKKTVESLLFYTLWGQGREPRLPRIRAEVHFYPRVFQAPSPLPFLSLACGTSHTAFKMNGFRKVEAWAFGGRRPRLNLFQKW